MKINYLFKNTGRICTVIGLLASTLLSGCLKDNSPGTINFGDSPALISWQYAGFTPVPYTAAIYNTGTQVYNLEVALSVASVNLGSAVSAKVSVDAASLTAYNTASGDNVTALPAAQYSLPSSVTIPAGSHLVKFPVSFDAAAIDFTLHQGFALVLTDANGATIPSNLNTAVVIVKLKSIYDDVYKVKSGGTTRYNGGTVASGFRDFFAIAEPTLDYVTVNASTVDGQYGSSSFGLTAQFMITGTTVVVTADAADGVTIVEGDSKGTSSYNPATKELIIHTHYLNSSGALREVDEDIVGE